MMRPLSRFLLRAPLLPLSSLRRPARAIFPDATAQKYDATASNYDATAQKALVWASPSLAAASGAKAERARENFARRAAFRPTPHGLWAGVLVGELGPRLKIATGAARAHLTVSYARQFAEARAQLEVPALREASRLRAAPSLIADDRQVEWLAFGDQSEAALRAAELDEPLAQTLEHAREWISFGELREAAGVDDEWLLRLVDDGLLVSDLEPPLIGAAPPASDQLEGSHAVLTFNGRGVLPQAAVERAAQLAPLLYRLQQALSPPAAERELVPLDAVETAAEIFGAGAFDLAALMRGEYGGVLGADQLRPPSVWPAPLLALLAERLSHPTIDFTAAELDAVTPFLAAPATAELFLQPTKDSRGRGWLVGLHGPAGSSWGRFAHALGAPLVGALEDLAEAEERARPGEQRLDVCFAPTRALADLAAHPPLRRGALALIGWPENAVPPSALELVADPSALEPLALRVAGVPVAPSPLHRLRSSTAPPGGHRLLVSWSLQRQHAPWAFSWGPFADLPRLPRVSVDGFVIAPASWRLPPSAADFRRWRKTVPRFVQIGEEDELLWFDLHGKDAWERLSKLRGRAWEIWPPLDQTPDRDGRRLEAVVALVDDAAATGAAVTAAAIAATAAAGRVELPRPAPGWLSYKLFGAPDRADGVLLGVVAPLIEGARGAGELARWFYLRYWDAPGRPHLRLRLLPSDGRAADLERRLFTLLEPARAAFDVVAVERGDYFPERGRFQDLPLVEEIFELDSDHSLALLDEEPKATNRLVNLLDALACHLDLPARRALAARRRQLFDAELDEDPAQEFRAQQRELIDLLRSPPPFSVHIRRRMPKMDERLLPTLLHLSVVRQDPAAEARAYYFWERALDGLIHQRPAAPRAP